MTGTTDLTVTVEPLDSEPPSGPPPTRSRRRRRWRVALVVAAALLVSGGAVSVVGWYGVKLPPPLALPETTTLYYADGTVLARMGNAQRIVVPYEKLVPAVIDVAVAAEDPGFWSAAASPITRAVLRHTRDLTETDPASRARMGVLALKLEATHSKEQILEQYLNAVPFGRNTYGIEAAAWTYFRKSANVTAPPDARPTNRSASWRTRSSPSSRTPRARPSRGGPLTRSVTANTPLRRPSIPRSRRSSRGPRTARPTDPRCPASRRTFRRPRW